MTQIQWLALTPAEQQARVEARKPDNCVHYVGTVEYGNVLIEHQYLIASRADLNDPRCMTHVIGFADRGN
jgi:hypothetical protein